jgi:hypothetical protein
MESTLSTDQADLTKPAGAIVSTSPATGTYIDATQAITLNKNPNPLPVIIPNPTSGGESATDYANALTAVGLAPQISVESDPTYGQSEGTVADVTPGVGSRLAVGQTVNIYSAPPTSDDETPDCRRSTPASPTDPGASRGFAWTSPGDSIWADRYAPYDGSQGDDPLAASGVLLQRNTGDGTMVNVNFLWGWENQAGTKGWGYRHIKYEHGWSVDDRADTTTALRVVPFSYNPSDPTSRLFYIGPEYMGNNATPCWRVVVVAPQAVAEGPKGNQVMESKPKGIITSYGAADPPPPPA